MPKAVQDKIHDFQDWTDGTFRVGAPPVVTGRPKAIFNENNPNLAALVADYPTSAQRQHNIDYANGADWHAYNQWQLAMDYPLNGGIGAAADETIARFGIAECEALILANEAIIEDYVLGTDRRGSSIAYDNWLYSNQLFVQCGLTYDWCYDLLTPAQRVRWKNVLLQFGYALFYNTDARFHNSAGTASANITWSAWGAGDRAPWFSSNYYHHHMLAAVVLGLVFEDDGIVLEMNGGPVTIDGKLFQDTLLVRDWPFVMEIANKLLPGGGTMEGTNYNVSIGDVFFAKSVYKWSKGIDPMVSLNPYLQESMRAHLHEILPIVAGTGERDYVLATGEFAGNPGLGLRDQVFRCLINTIGELPLTDVAPEIKLINTQLGSLTLNGSHYYNEAYRFLHTPVINTIDPALDFSSLPSFHAASIAGDNFFRDDWDDNSSTAFAVRSGEHHNGNHSHGDATSIQIWKDGWLFPNMQLNTNSTGGDHRRLSEAPLNALDRNDKRLLSIMGAGRIYETWPDGNSRYTSELNGYTPITRYAEDNRLTDGDMHISVDAAPTYQSAEYGQRVQVMQREVVYFDDTFLLFDRLVLTTSEQLTTQFCVAFTPTVAGNSFTTDNGTSSAELTLLSHPSATWNQTNITENLTYGDGAFQMRSILGTASSISVVTAININGATTTFALDSVTTPGAHAVTVNHSRLGTRVVTFYDDETIKRDIA